jgi:hypothetical protein
MNTWYLKILCTKCLFISSVCVYHTWYSTIPSVFVPSVDTLKMAVIVRFERWRIFCAECFQNTRYNAKYVECQAFTES